MAVIGSGPAGFYTASRVVTRLPDAVVDMYEQLPAPYGLVRHGVAPDHPEVKNCQDKFAELARSPRFNFIGNMPVGLDTDADNPHSHSPAHSHSPSLPLAALTPHYDALLLAYGASHDRHLHIPHEDTLRGIFSARAFVGWYNGLPEYRDLAPDAALTAGEEAVVIGQGNVALDVARILLTGVDRLRGTDITEYALEALAKSRVRRVRIVGRRGLAQASFTIKEIRELLHLPQTHLHSPIPPSLFPPPTTLATLPRAQKRLLTLLQTASPPPAEAAAGVGTPPTKSWTLDFLLSPTRFLPHPADSALLGGVEFQRTRFPPGPDTDAFSPTARTVPLEPPETATMETALAFRSIGYVSAPLAGLAEELGVRFDRQRGVVPNVGGRVVRVTPDGEAGVEVVPGVYVAGWVARGPTGVIARTMEEGFAVGEAIVRDWVAGVIRRNGGTGEGWEGVKRALPQGPDFWERRRVDWAGWEVIDKVERERGRARGKEREKFGSVGEMLGVLGK